MPIDIPPSAYEWSMPKQKTLCSIAKSHKKNMTHSKLDKDWKLHDFFKKIIVINLPSAKKRLKRLQREKRKIGDPIIEVFTGIDGRTDVDEIYWKKFKSNRERYDPSTEEGKKALDSFHKGEAGAYFSHYNVIKKIKKSFDNALKNLQVAKACKTVDQIKKAERRVLKYSRVLILEDDAAFGRLGRKKTLKGSGVVLRRALSKLPDDWDILYFVVHATGPTFYVSSNLRKLSTSWSTVCYAINYTMYEPIVNILAEIEDPSVDTVYPVDKQISEIQKSHNAYAIYPSLVYHQDGTSLISGRYRPKFWQGQPTFTAS